MSSWTPVPHPECPTEGQPRPPDHTALPVLCLLLRDPTSSCPSPTGPSRALAWDWQDFAVLPLPPKPHCVPLLCHFLPPVVGRHPCPHPDTSPWPQNAGAPPVECCPAAPPCPALSCCPSSQGPTALRGCWRPPPSSPVPLPVAGGLRLSSSLQPLLAHPPPQHPLHTHPRGQGARSSL